MSLDAADREKDAGTPREPRQRVCARWPGLQIGTNLIAANDL